MLTVVILLALLMYITSIMAFYLFADEAKLNATFGKFYIGMLKLFSFVTVSNQIRKGHVKMSYIELLVVVGPF